LDGWCRALLTKPIDIVALRCEIDARVKYRIAELPAHSAGLCRSAKCRSWPIATNIALQPNVRFQGHSDRRETAPEMSKLLLMD
jgi:hypothetical protein